MDRKTQGLKPRALIFNPESPKPMKIYEKPLGLTSQVNFKGNENTVNISLVSSRYPQQLSV